MDIRDKADPDHEDLTGLNFLRDNPLMVFRRHHRTGLRSHVIEVIPVAEVEKERNGVKKNGGWIFPKARPVGMLRIFKHRFGDLAQVLGEIRRVRLVETYLKSEYAALSTEIVADYRFEEEREIVLCGFQTYVPGRVLDPWRDLTLEKLSPFNPHDPFDLPLAPEDWRQNLAKNVAGFVDRIFHMIRQSAHIPDLAGVGNLMATPMGKVKLVDINNISPVRLTPEIRLDDKGYPVTDRSVEALYLLENRLLERRDVMNRPLYRAFLSPGRREKIQSLAAGFPDRVF